MKLSTNQLINLAFGAAAAALVVVAILAFFSVRDYVQTVSSRRLANQRLQLLGDFLSLLKDAETGQRGYLLTGSPDYLQPYEDAERQWHTALSNVERAFAPTAEHAASIARLHSLATQRMQLLAQTLALRRELTDPTGAELREIVDRTAGKQIMDELRAVVAEMDAAEEARVASLQSRAERLHLWSIGGSGALCLIAVTFVAVSGFLLRRDFKQVRALNDELERRVEQRTSELATANDELRERNQENEMFVYSVSHDLRSPLVNLQGFSQELDAACQQLQALAAREEMPASIRTELADIIAGDVAESIHFIRTSVTRLSSIIDALLRLSRAGRVVYQWQVVDVGEIVARVLDAAHGTITQRDAKIVVGELPAAWGDATAVEQVFANLLHNALHYLDHHRAGEVEVGILSDRPGPFHTYFVRDNGIGIPSAQMPKIFQAFQRLQPQHAPGEGMGLTLVQRIVARHGGTIWVDSTAGQGSTFCFTLPRTSAALREENSVPQHAGEVS